MRVRESRIQPRTTSEERSRRIPAAALVGPAIVGLAVWCAAGRLSVLDVAGASARVAVPAPWWVAVVAGVLASAVPAWRRDPVLASPAGLSTLAWWPVPLPPLALVWTGPLAW